MHSGDVLLVKYLKIAVQLTMGSFEGIFWFVKKARHVLFPFTRQQPESLAKLLKIKARAVYACVADIVSAMKPHPYYIIKIHCVQK